MDSLLESLVQINFLCDIHCPYTLFVTLYHMALPFEKMLLDEKNHEQDSSIGQRLALMPTETHEEFFNIDSVLAKMAPLVDNERKAALFAGGLLRVMDDYLSAAESSSYDAPGVFSTTSTGSIPSHIISRLKNTFYYHPIEVDVEGDKTSYIILPKIEPLYAGWITDALPRDESYFSTSLSSHFLLHHTIIENGKINNQKVTVLAGSDGPVGPNMFHHSLDNLTKLTIGLAPFDDGFRPVIETYMKTRENKIPFRYTRIEYPPKEEIKKMLQSIMRAAQEREVDILIFPELTVDHDAHTAICDFLSMENGPDKIKLVVAGSFHKERKEGGYVNEAIMLDCHGNVIWSHCKQKSFELKFEDVGNNEKKESICRSFCIASEECAVEHIYNDYPLTFMDTAIGRMTTLICLDFLLPIVQEVVARISCSYLWVPAMTTSIGSFIKEASETVSKKHHALTACCASRSCCELIKGKPESFSFLCAPSKKFKDPLKCKGVVRLRKVPLLIYRLDKML